MDEKKAKERENVQGNQDNPSCAFIILPHEVNNFADIWFLKEKVERESTGGWTRPIIHGNVFTMQTFQARSKLLVLQILETIAKATFQTIPNINFSTKDFSEGSCNCACDDNFLILENIFHLNLSQCLIVRTCQGKAYLSIGTKVKPIPIEDFYHLDALFIEMSGTKEAISNLLVKNIRMDEIGQKDPCLNGLITDHNLLKEVSELKYQYRKSDTQVQEIKQKLCAKINISIKQNGFDKHSSSDTPLQGEASTSRAHTLTQNIEHLSNNNSLVKHTYSLPRLLLSISRRLSLTDWDKLRCIVTNHVPERVLENIENGVKVLEELVNRNFINHGNLEFLRGILYEIKRVDLVHLVDCIEKGDYSLLNEKKSQGPRNSTQTKENTSISNGLPPHQNMQNLSLQTNHLVVDTLATRGDQPVTMTTNGNSATPRDDVMLQRKYKDLPRTSQVSPSYPIQENSANAIVSDSNEGAVTSGANTAMTRAETSASHEPTTSDSDSRHVGQAMGAGRDTSKRDQDSVGKTTWDKNPGFPCDHYERHCEVQFSCCEKFWPCHRCHNSESSCESRTLRSRDIKNVKCLRCGKVQQVRYF